MGRSWRPTGSSQPDINSVSDQAELTVSDLAKRVTRVTAFGNGGGHPELAGRPFAAGLMGSTTSEATRAN